MQPVHQGALDRELRDYVAVISRRRRVILASTLGVVAIALAISLLQTKVYEARAELLLRQPAPTGLLEQNQSVFPEREVQNEINVLESRRMRDQVADRIGRRVDVSVRAAEDADVISLGVRDDDPRRAAESVNAFASTYIDVRRQQTVDELLASGEEVRKKIADVEAQLEELTAPLDALDTRIAQASLGPERTALEQRRRDLSDGIEGRRDGLVDQQNFFEDQLGQVQLGAQLARSGGAQVLTTAAVPHEPVSPRPVRTGLIALFLGAVLGVGLAFLREHFDDSVKDEEDLVRSAPELPVLGLVPVVDAWRGKSPHIAALEAPHSSAAEAYRSLRTSIRFLGLDRPARIIQVTSPKASEGKTTTLANLAVALSQAGERVAVVCCDLRQPRLHELFGVSNEVGMTSLLLGEAELEEALQEVPVEGGQLRVLASGPLPPNPSELLLRERAGMVMRMLVALHDRVLVDAPPVLPVADAVVLARQVDATLLVTRAGVSSRHQVRRALDLLRQVDAPVIGTVLNAASVSGVYGYAYGYQSRVTTNGNGKGAGRRWRPRRAGSKSSREAGTT